MDAEPDIFLFPLVLREVETREESNHTNDAFGWISYRPKNK
jgi:hypothetical protein